MLYGKKHGFTLVELLIVTIILGILLITLVPRLIGMAERARNSARINDIAQISQALELYYNDNSTYPVITTGSLSYLFSYKPQLFALDRVFAADRVLNCEEEAEKNINTYVDDHASNSLYLEYTRYCKDFGFVDLFDIAHLADATDPNDTLVRFFNECEESMISKRDFLYKEREGQDHLSITVYERVREYLDSTLLPNMTTCIENDSIENCSEKYKMEFFEYIYKPDGQLDTLLALGGYECATDFVREYQANGTNLDSSNLAGNCIAHLNKTSRFMLSESKKKSNIDFVVDKVIPTFNACIKETKETKDPKDKGEESSAKPMIKSAYIGNLLVGTYIKSMPTDPSSTIIGGLGVCKEYDANGKCMSTIDVQSEPGAYGYISLSKNGIQDRGYLLMAALEGEDHNTNWLDSSKTIYSTTDQKDLEDALCDNLVVVPNGKEPSISDHTCYIPQDSDVGRYIRVSSQ